MADAKVKPRSLALPQDDQPAPAEAIGQPLRAGRRVLLRNSDEAQSIEIIGPDGALEVEVVLTDAGPLVRIKAGRMEITTTEDVDVSCRAFNVKATHGVTIESGDKLQLKSADDTDIDAGGDLRAKGETIWLN